jgi:hypothetical protein
MHYTEFLKQKQRVWTGVGHEVEALHAQLYPWQAAIVRWALKKGRACIFADCGLGKTFMQCAWADALACPTLILAPLCVAEQTVDEAAKLGITVTYATNQAQADQSGTRVHITNYERLEDFDPLSYEAVILDESSILKAFDGKTRTKLIQTFARTPYRLCCTATPSPNDIAELANHAEFLGLMTRAEFLATWFIHDDAGWRMKRHAVEPFYRWLSSWAVAFRRPSDLGYENGGFNLPPLNIVDHVVEGQNAGDALFPELGLKGLSGRLSSRRASLDARIAVAVNLATGTVATDRSGLHVDCQWLFWCGLNPEAEALAAAIPESVNVQGSDSYGEKRSAVEGFVSGSIQRLISKSRILGFGMNFQQCHHMAFVGLGDSYEQYYQCIRRCWRFGQTSPVYAHIIVSDAERAVVDNVRKKEKIHDDMATDLLGHMQDFEREELVSAC